MNKSYIYFFIFLVLSSFTFGYYCYQESANITNQTGVDGSCGLNYSGNYSDNNAFKALSSNNISRAYDGLTNTGVSSLGTINALLNVTYKKPLNSRSNSIWKTTLYIDNTLNVTIPNNCMDFDSTYLFLYGEITEPSSSSIWGCYSPTGKQELRRINSTNWLYEEGIYWNFYNITNGSITNSNTNISSRYFNITWSNATSTESNISSFVLDLYSSNNIKIYTLNTTSSKLYFNWDSYAYNLSNGVDNYYLNLTYFDEFNTSTFTLKNISILTNSLLNISARMSNNSILTNYSLSLKDLVTNVSVNYSNLSNFQSFDVVRNRSYQYNISSPNFATTVNNYTVLNLSYQTLNVSIGAFNTLLISIIDEKTNASILQPIAVTVQTNNSFNNYSTSSGSLNISNQASGINLITFTSANYSTRSYTINLVDGSYEALTVRLLSNSNSSIIGIYSKTSTYQVLPDVLYTIQKQYVGGSYATVLQGFTDEAGFATFYIDTSINYRVILSVDGYTTKQFNQQFYVANSPYTFVLNSVSSTPYINVFDNVQYYYSPTITQLNHSIYNFSMTSYSNTVPIAWTSVNVNGSITTVYGSLSGGTASAIVDLSNVNGSLPVIFSFNYYDVNVDDYLTYSIPIGYFVKYDTAYNNSLPIAMNNLKDDVDSSAWLGILAVLIIFAGVATVMQLSGNVLAGVMTGFMIMVFLAFIGWISGLLVAIIIILSILALYSDQGGF